MSRALSILLLLAAPLALNAYPARLTGDRCTFDKFKASMNNKVRS